MNRRRVNNEIVAHVHFNTSVKKQKYIYKYFLDVDVKNRLSESELRFYRVNFFFGKSETLSNNAP